MKKWLLIVGIMNVWCACNTNSYMPGFDYKLFKNTPVWELAKAVEKEDTNQIVIILKDTTLKIDYHERKFGNTLLMLAVASNKKKAVKKLLEYGANPNEKDYFNNSTSIVFACEYHSDDCDTIILKMLIEHHSDVNFIQKIDRIEDNGAHSFVCETVLMTAVKINCLNIIKILVDAGADINKYTYYEGYGAITEALIQDNIAIAKYLIIDRHAKIPEYCNIRNRGEKDEQKLTITAMLNEREYDHNSDNYKYKKEIINYLKNK